MKLIVVLVSCLAANCFAFGGNGQSVERFKSLWCGRRIAEGYAQKRLVPAIVDALTVRYLESADSLYDLGRRFEAVSKGRFASYYPDAKLISELIDKMENTKLCQNQAMLVGVRDTVMEMVSRPVAKYEVSYYRTRTYLERLAGNGHSPNGFDVALFGVEHHDGSSSFALAYRDDGEGKPVISDRGDYRELLNVFGISRGPSAGKAISVFSRSRTQLVKHEVDSDTLMEGIERALRVGEWRQIKILDSAPTPSPEIPRLAAALEMVQSNGDRHVADDVRGTPAASDQPVDGQ